MEIRTTEITFLIVFFIKTTSSCLLYQKKFQNARINFTVSRPVIDRRVTKSVYEHKTEKGGASQLGYAVYLTSAANMLFLLFYRFIRRIQNSPDEKIFKLFQKICTNMLKFSNVCDNIWCKS